MTIDDVLNPQTPPTSDQVKAALGMVMAVGDALQELGSVPSGELYARLMGHMTIGLYTKVIDTLKGANLVKEQAHLLTWIGPKKKAFAPLQSAAALAKD